MQIDGLVQDGSVAIANAMEIPQSCTKPSIFFMWAFKGNVNVTLLRSTKNMSMVWCKTAVSPLLTHWRYCSLALTHHLCGFFKGNVNVALLRPAIQSSIYMDDEARNAVDGVIDIHHRATTAHYDFNPWWKVKLAYPIWVGQVEITGLTGKQISKIGYIITGGTVHVELLP